MKVIKEGNTKKQCICEYCGTIIEYDAKEDIPASGIEWFKFECPLCNNTIRPNTKLDVEKIMKSMVTEKVKDELINIYKCINIVIKSRSFTEAECIIIDSILSIISQHIQCFTI